MIQEEDWQDCSNTQVGMQKSDQTLCTRITNYVLLTCQEDTSGKLWKSVSCYDRI